MAAMKVLLKKVWYEIWYEFSIIFGFRNTMHCVFHPGVCEDLAIPEISAFLGTRILVEVFT